MKATLGLALLLGCLTGLLWADDSIDIAKLTITCLAENGVTPQDLADLKTGVTPVKDANDNVKCASQCIFVKSGLMDGDGNLLTNNLKKKFNVTTMDPSFKKALATCAEIKGDNPCDKAFQIMGCLQANSKENANQVHK